MFYFWLLLLWNIVFKFSLMSACHSDLSHSILGGKYEFIGLTLPLGNATFFPDTPKNKFNRFEDTTMTVSIIGTRIEAPKDHEMYVSELPLEKLIVQLIIIDVSGEVEDDPNYVLNMKDINSTLDSDVLYHMSLWPSLVIVKFGWSHYYYHDPKKYFGHDYSTNSNHLPALSNEVAEWLTRCECCKKIVGIGTDLPLLYAGGNNASDSVRKSLTKAGLYIVEGLSLNYTLPNYQCTAVVAPAKIKESIAPSNVIAICPKDHNDNNDRHKHEMRKRHSHLHEMEPKQEMSAEQEKHEHGMEHGHDMCGHHMHDHGMGHGNHMHEHEMEHEHEMSEHQKHEHGMSEHHKHEDETGMGHEHGMCGHHMHEHGMEYELSGHMMGHGHKMLHHHKHERNASKQPDPQTNNQMNITHGSNKANEKPNKIGETENKQPNLKTQQIIGGIKDKLKEFVKTSK